MKKDSDAIPIIVLIVLVTILTRGLLIHYSNHFADDSFITFRYAENIASGKGFVYNQGERVLGTSTPLYTLLLALLAKLGLPILLFARVLNIGADCLSGILIFLLLRVQDQRGDACRPLLRSLPPGDGLVYLRHGDQPVRALYRRISILLLQE
jgi:hypothetical protein